MNDPRFSSIATPELINMLLSNKELIDAINDVNKDELVVINNDCKVSCKGMPLLLKAILCNIRIHIDNTGVTDIEINKIENSEDFHVKKLYKTLIQKYFKDYQSLSKDIDEQIDFGSIPLEEIKNIPISGIYEFRELIKLFQELIKNYIQMNEGTKKLVGLNTDYIIKKTRLEEKSEALKLYYRVKKHCNSGVSRYIRETRSKILELKNELDNNENYVLTAEYQNRKLIEAINDIETTIFRLLNRVENQLLSAKQQQQ